MQSFLQGSKQGLTVSGRRLSGHLKQASTQKRAEIKRQAMLNAVILKHIDMT